MKKRIITIIIIVSLGISSCRSRQGFTVNDSHKCRTESIDKMTLTDLLYSGDYSGMQFIDLRAPHEFAMGHLPGAVNIPFKNFFARKYQSQIKPDKVLIAYGDGSEAQLAAMLGYHFMNAQIYFIPAGYDYIRDKIMRRYAIHSGIYNDEIPVVDFREAMKEVQLRYGGGSAKPVKKAAAPATPVVKHKKKEVTGGCG